MFWGIFFSSSISSLVILSGSSSKSSCLSIWSRIRRYSSICPFIHLILSSSLFLVKLWFFELQAKNLLPSIEVNPHSTALLQMHLSCYSLMLYQVFRQFAHYKNEMILVWKSVLHNNFHFIAIRFNRYNNPYLCHFLCYALFLLHKLKAWYD